MVGKKSIKKKYFHDEKKSMKKSIGRKKKYKKSIGRKKSIKKSINNKMFLGFISVKIQYTNVNLGKLTT